MRAIIAKPMYRALKTLVERKQAFQDYVDDLRKKEEVSSRIILLDGGMVKMFTWPFSPRHR